MTFFGRWEPGHCMVLCVDTPDCFREQMKHTMESERGALDLNDPFALHIPLMDQIITLYNQSVWSIRDLIRRMEKVFLWSVLANQIGAADHLQHRRGRTTVLSTRTSQSCTKFLDMQPILQRRFL